MIKKKMEFKSPVSPFSSLWRLVNFFFKWKYVLNRKNLNKKREEINVATWSFKFAQIHFL